MTVYRMLQFFYKGNYDDAKWRNASAYPNYVASMTPRQAANRLGQMVWIDANFSTDIIDDDQRNDGTDDENETQETNSVTTSHTLGRSSDGRQVQPRIFKGHGLFDSLRVYNLASKLEIQQLMLLAGQRFNYTIQFVVAPLYSSSGEHWDITTWPEHQQAYQQQLTDAIYKDFLQVIR